MGSDPLNSVRLIFDDQDFLGRSGDHEQEPTGWGRRCQEWKGWRGIEDGLGARGPLASEGDRSTRAVGGQSAPAPEEIMSELGRVIFNLARRPQ